MAMAENHSFPSSSTPPPTHIASLQSQEPLLLRSSPPRPPLPPPPTLFTSPSLSYSHSSRKRQSHHLLETEDALPSSDPAYFSSDDIANACAENYTVERKKRRYRGSWWEHHHQYHHDHALARVHHESVTGDGEISVKKQQQQQPKSKGFSRNFDSGVWMGSDDSEEQFDDRGLQEGEKEEDARQKLSFSQNKDGFLGNVKTLSDFNDERKQQTLKESKDIEHIDQRAKEISAEEKFASEVVASCLEHGNTSVDLSHCNLKSINSETLRPLHQLIRMPLAAFEAPVEEAYRPLKPTLKLFLGNNGLSSIPPELWNFKNLTVLSLRNNDLKFLSPSIARLKSLEYLNISANRIRYLPWEMLSLLCPTGILRHNVLDSNDYLHSDDSEVVARDWYRWRGGHELGLWRKILPRKPHVSTSLGAFFFLTSTPAAYFARNGQPSPHSQQRPYSHLARDDPASETKLENQIKYHRISSKATDQEFISQRNDTSRVPSLFELSLRSVAANCETLPSFLFPTGLDDDASTPPAARLEISLPPAVEAGLEEVRRVWNDGGRNCSVCQRPYVNPRSEWLELWCWTARYLTNDDHGFCQKPFYPFLRRCCGCIDPINTLALGKAYSDREWAGYTNPR